MSTANSFWDQVISSGLQVVNCQTCHNLQQSHKAKYENAKSESYPDLGFPQPGWVGPRYSPGLSVVFILQNPSVGGLKNPVAELEFQNALRTLASDPCEANYHSYVAIAMRQMPGWDKWNDIIAPLIQGWMEPEQISWINAVKYRTQENEKPSSTGMHHSSANHLPGELLCLDPAAVIRVSSIAQYTHSRVTPLRQTQEILYDFPMRGTGSSRDDARSLGKQVRSDLERRGLL